MTGYITYAPVRKRDGRLEAFNFEKIYWAVHKCCQTGCEMESFRSNLIASEVKHHCETSLNPLRTYTVEEIQDHVEEILMGLEEPNVARAYILYRAEHSKQREECPIDAEETARVEKNRRYFKDPIAEFQFYSKYARWNEEEGRRETWEECVDRVIGFLRKKFGDVLTEWEWAFGRDMILKQDALPSMRLMQMAGPAAERCNICVYNCAYTPIDKLSRFGEILYILMQGTGCGFSVEEKYVRQLPQVRHQRRLTPLKYVIGDSTDHWCDALVYGLAAWCVGEDVEFDYSHIRPQGARLRTKGGRSSGPLPLKELLTFARSRVLARQGGYLTTEDCHDIACMCGYIVQVGGVRRAAMISLSDLADLRIRDAKSGHFWIENPQRAMANNSAVYLGKPSVPVLMEEILALYKSGSGERGIFNRGSLRKQIPQRRQLAEFGVNPCGELILRPQGLCNLSIAVARSDDSEPSLKRKVKWATIWGTLQSGLTDFDYLPTEWRQNAEEERLLGVDITGQMDCYPLSPNAAGRERLLENLKELVIQTNVEIADRMGIRPSVAATCIKPSGNSAQLLGCSSGIHPRYAKYYVRRVRSGAYDPLSKLMREAGVPCYPEVGSASLESASVWVFEFPIASPPGALTRHDLNATQQLNNWLVWKRHYTEHNPSCTIYVGEDEWIKVADWLHTNWEMVGGLSFLPKEDSGHSYELAPYSEIGEEEYERRVSEFPAIPFAKLRRFEHEDNTTSAQEYACIGDKCSI